MKRHQDITRLTSKVSYPATAFVVLALGLARLDAASLSISPASGPANAFIAATASGFLPQGTNYANTGYYSDGGFVGACPSSSGPSYANCDVQFRAPTGVGPHQIKAQNSFGESATKTYTVVTPSFTIVPTCGQAGTPVTCIGHNFPSAWNIGIYIDDSYSGNNALTDESGNFEITFPMPGSGNGNHNIAGKDSVGDNITSVFSITTNCIGSVYQADGPVTVRHPDGTTGPLAPGSPIQQDDVIITGAGGDAAIHLIDQTTLKMSENSRLAVDNYVFDPNNNAANKASYNVIQGAFQYVSGLIAKKPDPDVSIETVFGEIGIRGTEFIARQDPCSTTQEVYLIHGELAITPRTTGITNICDAPVAILLSSNTVSTSLLAQFTYDSISNSIFTNTTLTLSAWLVQYFGCTNNPAANPNADPDGDGQNNLAEFLAGTDPVSSASAFRILSAMRTDNNLLVTWTCGSGKTNVLQATATPNGGWTNLSGNTVLPDGSAITNYLDIGAITSTPARFYRVQLIP